MLRCVSNTQLIHLIAIIKTIFFYIKQQFENYKKMWIS